MQRRLHQACPPPRWAVDRSDQTEAAQDPGVATMPSGGTARTRRIPGHGAISEFPKGFRHSGHGKPPQSARDDSTRNLRRFPSRSHGAGPLAACAGPDRGARCAGIRVARIRRSIGSASPAFAAARYTRVPDRRSFRGVRDRHAADRAPSSRHAEAAAHARGASPSFRS
jgi:hypothetical protein